MAEYIEREAALKVLCDACGNAACPKGLIPRCSYYEKMQSIPATDVRPVVLCRDCKYYYKDADGYEMCENSEGYDHVREDGFCAWAKRGRKADAE